MKSSVESPPKALHCLGLWRPRWAPGEALPPLSPGGTTAVPGRPLGPQGPGRAGPCRPARRQQQEVGARCPGTRRFAGEGSARAGVRAGSEAASGRQAPQCALGMPVTQGPGGGGGSPTLALEGPPRYTLPGQEPAWPCSRPGSQRTPRHAPRTPFADTPGNSAAQKPDTQR